MNNETNKPKHTPGPWDFIEDDPLFGTIIKSEGLILCRIRSLECVDYNANAKRIVACVNAMEGIEDPQEFVKVAKRREKLLETILGEIQMTDVPREIDVKTAIESIRYLIEKEINS